MTGTAVRVGMYQQREGALPTSLNTLPIRQGYDNETTDGWNQPLIYAVDEGGFSLKSLGRDGVPGGSGEDGDIIRKYRLVNGHPEEIR